MESISDISLVAQVAVFHNRRAFDQLVRKYQSPVRRFLLNLTLGNEALSDDLAQETFVKAYIEIRSFRGLSRFGTWLFRIAYNEFYSYKRSQHATSDLDAVPEQAASPIESMDVKTAMAQLSEIERTVVTLFYIDDMPLKQVATITGLKESTLRSHLHRAREKMATTLNHD